MNSPKFPASTASSSHRKQHNQSSSLGSLYEVLADLDETELQYLVQELNHTGHQNLSVSEAVSTFEGQGPSEKPNTKPKAYMLPPAQVPQRQLSKSQRGKLRLQTAFQRATSLPQRPSQEKDVNDRAIHKTREALGQEPTNDIPAAIIKPPNFLPIQAQEVHGNSLKPQIKLEKDDDTVENIPLNSQAGSRGVSPAYRYIPRPDFHLPDGITVADLLQLLEVEFLSSRSQQPSSRSSPSLSPESGMPLVSTALLLSPASPISFQNASHSRPLRRVSSRLDMVLEAERAVSGTEEIGLGMLEPRQQTSALRDTPIARPPITPVNLDSQLKGVTPPPLTTPVVLEGILDVLENY